MEPRVPYHIAIIMDGNGRWGRQRGLSRSAGHKAGVENVRRLVKMCRQRGVKVLTLYAFSTENWSRPSDEVQTLMDLLVFWIRRDLTELKESGVRLAVLGHPERLPLLARQEVARAVRETSSNSELVLNVALNYGARAELVDAARQLAEEVRQGQIAPNEIDEAALGTRLDTAGLPDPDLLIRTGGELRLSNFLLWQVAYTELYFSPVLFPDFGEEELDLALAEYAGRQRRFGGLAAEEEGASAPCSD
ncbi:MAG: isoprenyl transferase [Bacillota bacterium]